MVCFIAFLERVQTIPNIDWNNWVTTEKWSWWQCVEDQEPWYLQALMLEMMEMEKVFQFVETGCSSWEEGRTKRQRRWRTRRRRRGKRRGRRRGFVLLEKWFEWARRRYFLGLEVHLYPLQVLEWEHWKDMEKLNECKVVFSCVYTDAFITDITVGCSYCTMKRRTTLWAALLQRVHQQHPQNLKRSQDLLKLLCIDHQ